MGWYRYRDNFETELYRRIQEGGRQVKEMLAMVDMYRGDDEDSAARLFLFRDWVGETGDFLCTACRRSYCPDPHAVHEDHYMLCGGCTKKYEK